MVELCKEDFDEIIAALECAKTEIMMNKEIEIITAGFKEQQKYIRNLKETLTEIQTLAQCNPEGYVVACMEQITELCTEALKDA